MALLKHVMKGLNEIVAFDHHAIRYPQLASVKMDGFRLLNLCGEKLLSPALKPFPNENMRKHLYHFLVFCEENRIVTDGEFWSPTLTFQALQSVVRSHNKPIPADVKYYIFDAMSEEEWDSGKEKIFNDRYKDAFGNLVSFPNVQLVDQIHISDAVSAEHLFETMIEDGQEGIILRNPYATYKHGRTTLRQDGMWKFKQFLTLDTVIVGIEEGTRMKAGLARTMNEIGELERTYRNEDYEPNSMVGAFVCQNNAYEPTFKVKPGKGHDNYLKTKWWLDYQQWPEKWRGKHIEYKYMPHGTMDKPRIGNLVRFRPDLD